MASTALTALLEALQEIQALQLANPSPTAKSPFKGPAVKRAIGRGQVVLLSSHFERYIYEVNEEAIEFLLSIPIGVVALPVKIRLMHARAPIDAMVETSWEHREEGLRAFALHEAPLWDDGSDLQTFEHERLLEWMKAPKSKKLVRYFSQWEVANIFDSVTRKESVRTDLWLRIDELVDKRNNIAHGDLTVEATHLDIQKYLRAVRTFTTRVDRHFSKVLARLSGAGSPW
jgi:hypothetical protein